MARVLGTASKRLHEAVFANTTPILTTTKYII